MGRFFLMLWPDISRMGRITSDVIRGMSVTQFIGVGHIAISHIVYPYGATLNVNRV